MKALGVKHNAERPQMKQEVQATGINKMNKSFDKKCCV
jgi:hypothetical protein